MINSVITENDIVYLYFGDGIYSHEVYSSKVFSATEDKLYIYMPRVAGKLIKPPIKAIYTLKIYTKSKGIITSDFKVTNYGKHGEQPLVALEPITDIIEKIQRREFFRLDCALPIKFSYIESDYTSDSSEVIKVHDGIVRDIGGGGMKFISKQTLRKGDVIQCVIALNKQYLVSTAKVLDVTTNKDAKAPHQYRITFTVIDRADKDKIVQYIFDAHRKMLKRTQHSIPDI